MNLWIGDYLELRNEIDYLEFKLNDEKLNDEERVKTQEELQERLDREQQFKLIVRNFKGVDSKILYGKYVEGKSLKEVAIDLGYVDNHVYNKHAEIMKIVKFAEENKL